MALNIRHEDMAAIDIAFELFGRLTVLDAILLYDDGSVWFGDRRLVATGCTTTNRSLFVRAGLPIYVVA